MSFLNVKRQSALIFTALLISVSAQAEGKCSFIDRAMQMVRDMRKVAPVTKRSTELSPGELFNFKFSNGTAANGRYLREDAEAIFYDVNGVEQKLPWSFIDRRSIQSKHVIMEVDKYASLPPLSEKGAQNAKAFNSPDLSKKLSNFGKDRNGQPSAFFEQHLNENINRYRYVVENANGSQLFHGSGSSSLLGFLGKSPEGLVPTGELAKQGKIPFGGEMKFGIDSEFSVNQKSLSTFSFDNFERNVEYASQGFNKGWTPEKAMQNIQELQKQSGEIPKKSIEIEKQRIKQWDRLTSQEKALVEEGFPVIYGIAPAPEKRMRWISYEGPSGQKEIAIAGGARPSEVRVVFVPADKVEMVRNILRNSNDTIRVAPIEQILNSPNP